MQGDQIGVAGTESFAGVLCSRKLLPNLCIFWAVHKKKKWEIVSPLLNTNGQLTNTRLSDGAPELDGAGRWLGQRFYIIANCILIVQTP